MAIIPSVEGHQDRVDVLAAAAVVVLAEALALEAELLVELDRRLVPGEDVQLELVDAGVAGPRDRLLEQGAADAAAAVARGDHQAEVGDVAAGGVRVAGDREAADDGAVVLGDEHGGVRVALQRAQVAALLGDAAPAVGVQQPGLRLAADGRSERDEGGGVLGPRGRIESHPTTIPWPPRRGSPAAARLPSALRSTAATPPK